MSEFKGKLRDAYDRHSSGTCLEFANEESFNAGAKAALELVAQDIENIAMGLPTRTPREQVRAGKAYCTTNTLRRLASEIGGAP